MSDDLKFDFAKDRHDLIPPEAITALAKILTHGATKYGPRGWERGMEWGRLYAATQRHLLAFWAGENNDPESAHPHLWHALTNIAFLLTYQRRGIGNDDRPEVR